MQHCLRTPLAAAFLLIASTAFAQRGSVAMLAPGTMNSLGLERAWFTRVTVDSARGSVAGLYQHVSSRQYTVFEVAHDGDTTYFSERDLDRTGNLLGKEGAERLARQKVNDLQRQQLTAQMTSHVVPEVTLYVATDRGLVQAVDAETGRIRWTTAIGNPLYPSEAPGASDDHVAVVNGVEIYVLNAADGHVVWQRRSRGAPAAGPAVTGRFVFVPLFNGAIEAYQLDDHRSAPWVFRSHDRTLLQPVATPNIVAWSTDGGQLYVAEARRTNVLFRLETNASIVAAPAVLPPARLLVGATDGYLYCVHHTTGAIQWQVSLGEPILQSPVVIGEAIYVITRQHGLVRLAAATGAEQWRTSGIDSFLAASDQRVYCVGRTGQLVAISTETGAAIGSLPTEALDLRLPNHRTDRIYIGTQSGFLQCLHEAHRPLPMLHVSLPVEAPAGSPQPSEPPTQPSQPVEPAVADPFAAPGDPFNSPGDGPPTMPPDRDPFAVDPPR
jgi:outer membrane protein assembly factor BamB